MTAEENRARSLVWYHANKEHVAEYVKANREKIREASAKRYAAKREEILAAAAARYAGESDSDRAKRTARVKKWARANPEKLAASAAKSYAANPEKTRAQNKRWRAANTEKWMARSAKWRAENADIARAATVRWRAENVDRVAVYDATHSAKRRTLLNDAGSFTAGEWRRLLQDTGHRCLCCGIAQADAIYRYPIKGEPLRGRLTKDHVLPLTKGGTNAVENIQPLCLPCNQRKQNKYIDYRSDTDAPERRTG